MSLHLIVGALYLFALRDIEVKDATLESFVSVYLCVKMTMR